MNLHKILFKNICKTFVWVLFSISISALTACGYNLKGETLIPTKLFPIRISGNTPDFILQNNKYVWVQKLLAQDLQELQPDLQNSAQQGASAIHLFFEYQSLEKDELLSSEAENTSILTMQVGVSAKDKDGSLVWNKEVFSSRTNFVKPSTNLNLELAEQEALQILAQDLVEQIKLRLVRFKTN